MSDTILVGESDIVLVTPGGVEIISVGLQGPPGPIGTPGPDVAAASFITRIAESGLSNEFALASLATGLLRHSGSGNLAIAAASDVPDLPASKITSGAFDAARIPDLAAAKITSGTLDNARVNWAAPGAIGSGTPSSGAFTTLSASGNLAVDTNVLFVNAANNRVGVNNGSPTYDLDVTGNFRASLVAFVGSMRGASSTLGVIGVTGSSSLVASVVAEAATQVVWNVRGFTAHTAHLQQWQDVSQNVLSFVEAGGPATFGALSSGTNDIQSTLTTRRNSTNTPAAGFGNRLLFQLESSTTENQDAAQIETSWVVATHASRTARVRHLVNDSGGVREAIRYEADGSAARLGFFGATAVARPNLGTWGSLTDGQKLDVLRDALSNLGLASYS